MVAVPHDLVGVLVGTIALGAIHGIEPGHGWPVAAAYALDQSNKWAYGFAASLLIGVGHLISSIAMVAVFFYATAYFDLAQVNQPISVFGYVQIGGPVSVVAGLLLSGLGVREYRHGHSHWNNLGDDHHGSGGHDHDDGPDGHGHGAAGGFGGHLRGVLPSVGQSDADAAADRGLLGIAWFAFLLGFAHEEEFEIIALCAGSNFCLELMLAYALTVIVGIVGLTMLLIAGYGRFEAQVERYTPYLPSFSAAVLVVMGLGFITGVL